MPYLLLVIGVLIGLFALYRFFISANVKQIKAFFAASITLIFLLALLYLALTGRLIAALVGIVGIIPVLFGWITQLRAAKRVHEAMKNSSDTLTRAEALEILGLTEEASEEDIKAAYKRLIKKIHPDHEGSEWMTAKLNEAKDLLLKD